MKKLLALFALFLGIVVGLEGGQPHLANATFGWAPYTVPEGCSNAVIAFYKATSLGTVFTPFKPTAYFPASRTNGTLALLPGTYQLYIVCQLQPLPWSDPSSTITVTIAP